MSNERKCLMTQQNAEVSLAFVSLLLGFFGTHLVPRLPVGPETPTVKPGPTPTSDLLDSIR